MSAELSQLVTGSAPGISREASLNLQSHPLEGSLLSGI